MQGSTCERALFPDAKATAERVELTGQGSFGSPPVNTEFRLWGEVTAAPAAAQFALRDGGIALRRLAVESLRIVDAELSLEGDLDFDATNRQARLAIRATTATMDTRGPTATTTFTMGEGTLQANLHSGEMVLDVPEVAVSTTAPTLGLKRMEAILGGPIHGGPAALRVPRIQADLAFAATPGIPVTLDGTLALRGALELAGQRLRLEGLVSSSTSWKRPANSRPPAAWPATWTSASLDRGSPSPGSAPGPMSMPLPCPRPWPSPSPETSTPTWRPRP